MSVPWYLMAKGKGGGYKTASGPIVSISDAVAAPLRSLLVSIDPVQDLHGYDNPWPAGGGKNLCKPFSAYITKDGITFSEFDDGRITISGTSTANTWMNDSNSGPLKKMPLKSGTYILNGNTSDSNLSLYLVKISGGTTSYDYGNGVTFTLEADDEVYIQINVQPGKTVNATIYPMIRLASVSDATFAPYSNICPISGWTGANVWRTGKNLLDETARKNAVQNVRYYYGIGTLLKAGEYTLSASETVSGIYVRNIDNTAIFTKYGSDFLTFTLTSDTLCYFDFYFANGASSSMTFQLELGSTPTAYEPYVGTTIPISWQSEAGTVYGGEVDVLSGVLTVDRVADTFTNDSAWYGFSTGAGNTSAVVQLSQYQNCKFVDGSAFYNGSISSTGKEAANYWVGARQNEVPNEGDMCFAYSQTGQLRFHRLDVSNITDLESFKAAFPDTVVCYYLATPITIPLTPQEISTLQGTNNLWADSGDVTVEYVAAGGSDPSLMKLAIALGRHNA